MMPVTYLLAPAVLARVPEIRITQQEYLDAKRCHKQVYEAFEIELAFDFVVTNYIEIENTSRSISYSIWPVKLVLLMPLDYRAGDLSER